VDAPGELLSNLVSADFKFVGGAPPAVSGATASGGPTITAA
jgi:hypothetical protein